MSTGRWKFRPTDLTRALKAAKAAGVPVRIEIESDKMVVYSCDIGPTEKVQTDVAENIERLI